MASSLAKRLPHRDLTPPRTLVTHCQSAIPFLLQVLNDPSNNNRVRDNAAYLLAECGDPCIDALLAIATKPDESPEVRACAIKAMRRSDDPRLIAAATTALFNRTEKPEVRIAAACVLADLKGQDAVDQLSAVARDTTNSAQVRFWAAIDLVFVLNGKIDDIKIVQAMKGDPKMFVTRLVEGEIYLCEYDARRAAFHALIDHGETQAVKSEARRLLRELVYSDNEAIEQENHRAVNDSIINIGCLVWLFSCVCLVIVLLFVMYGWSGRWKNLLVVIISIFTVVDFGVGILSLMNVIGIPMSQRTRYTSDYTNAKKTDDPTWEKATICEDSWVDGTCDDLPHLHPIKFCGAHYKSPPAYWRPACHYLSPTQIQHLLTGNDPEKDTRTEADESDKVK